MQSSEGMQQRACSRGPASEGMRQGEWEEGAGGSGRGKGKYLIGESPSHNDFMCYGAVEDPGIWVLQAGWCGLPEEAPFTKFPSVGDNQKIRALAIPEVPVSPLKASLTTSNKGKSKGGAKFKKK